MGGRLPATTAAHMLPALLPVIAADLDVSVVAFGIFIGLSESAGMVAPAAGWVVGRWGTVRTTALSLVAFIGVTAALALSPGIWMFGPALVVLGLASMGYETAATAWISEAAPPNSRSRWLGRLDVAWPLGLLVGAPLAALLAEISWRLSYATLVLLAAIALLTMPRYLHHPPGQSDQPPARERAAWRAVARRGWRIFAAFGFVAASAQIVIVIFGLWLADTFDFSVSAIGAVAAVLGVGQLAAVLSTMRFTDRLGGWRAAAGGAALVLVSAISLAFVEGYVVPGVAALLLLLAGHEFALVSAKPLLGDVTPDNPAIGIGLGFGVASAFRGVAAITSALAYTAGGVTLVASLSAMLAVVAVGLFRTTD